MANETMDVALVRILKDITTGIYLPENIFFKFQNDYTLPASNDFITISELDTTSMGFPQNYYNNVTEQMLYNNLDSTEFQVDFYGEFARSSASNFKNKMKSSYGSELLAEYNFSVHNVTNLINMSDGNILDRQNYVLRFLVRLTIFNNTYVAANTPYAKYGEVNVINADTV